MPRRVVMTFVASSVLWALAACDHPLTPVPAPASEGFSATDRPAASAMGSADGVMEGALLGAVAPADPEPPDARTQEPACPDGMVLVEGDYCPKVRHRCLRYLDHAGKFRYYRCAEYERPARCLADREPMRFCIDRDEYTRPGERLPANHQSWTDAKRTCEALGKRLCLEEEYNFACEGEEMRPYPYGWKRDASACNADKVDIIGPDGKLKDLRAPADAYPRCTSPFGVRHLAGNLEEFVTRTGSKPPWPAMKGAYWQPSRNFCRANQTAHDHYYNGTETGFRCCADAPEAAAGSPEAAASSAPAPATRP